MTEPPSPTWDPGAAGGQPQDPSAPPQGFQPPRQQPPGQPQDGPAWDATAPGGYPPGGYPQGGGAPGGYPPGGMPPGGYPPPTYYPPTSPPPLGYATADDKTWALIAHFGGAAGMFISGFLGWVAPLIALVNKGNQSPTVRAHAVAALNFHLTWTIVAVVGYITLCFFIGFIILPIAWLVGVILGIIGGLRANEGQLYHYPMSISIVK
ncbi:DUF4870 domain-containing protein [Rugosimonospora acidiphila]